MHFCQSNVFFYHGTRATKNSKKRDPESFPRSLILAKRVWKKQYLESSSSFLVGGFNPFEKYARQNGFIFPNFRGENKKYLSCHHPVFLLTYDSPMLNGTHLCKHLHDPPRDPHSNDLISSSRAGRQNGDKPHPQNSPSFVSLHTIEVSINLHIWVFPKMVGFPNNFHGLVEPY